MLSFKEYAIPLAYFIRREKFSWDSNVPLPTFIAIPYAPRQIAVTLDTASMSFSKSFARRMDTMVVSLEYFLGDIRKTALSIGFSSLQGHCNTFAMYFQGQENNLKKCISFWRYLYMFWKNADGLPLTNDATPKNSLSRRNISGKWGIRWC